MAHSCHATGCEERVPPSMWGCKKHWFMVEPRTRKLIWAHYREGQERDWRPSKEYLLEARRGVVQVASIEGVVPDTSLYDAFLRDLEDEP